MTDYLTPKSLAGLSKVAVGQEPPYYGSATVSMGCVTLGLPKNVDYLALTPAEADNLAVMLSQSAASVRSVHRAVVDRSRLPGE